MDCCENEEGEERPKKEEKGKEVKGSKKEVVKTKTSSFCFRAPFQRLGTTSHLLNASRLDNSDSQVLASSAPGKVGCSSTPALFGVLAGLILGASVVRAGVLPGPGLERSASKAPCEKPIFVAFPVPLLLTTLPTQCDVSLLSAKFDLRQHPFLLRVNKVQVRLVTPVTRDLLLRISFCVLGCTCWWCVVVCVVGVVVPCLVVSAFVWLVGWFACCRLCCCFCICLWSCCLCEPACES